MTDQQLNDFRRFVENCELSMHRCSMDLWLVRLLRPVLDDIDRNREEIEMLQEQLVDSECR